jgi:hypothetical protein
LLFPSFLFAYHPCCAFRARQGRLALLAPDLHTVIRAHTRPAAEIWIPFLAACFEVLAPLPGPSNTARHDRPRRRPRTHPAHAHPPCRPRAPPTAVASHSKLDTFVGFSDPRERASRPNPPLFFEIARGVRRQTAPAAGLAGVPRACWGLCRVPRRRVLGPGAPVAPCLLLCTAFFQSACVGDCTGPGWLAVGPLHVATCRTRRNFVPLGRPPASHAPC